MIKAIFFDIDGTLRDFEEKGIPEYTRKALDKACLLYTSVEVADSLAGVDFVVQCVRSGVGDQDVADKGGS